MLFLLQLCVDYFFCIFKIIYTVLTVRGICRKYRVFQKFVPLLYNPVIQCDGT